MERSRTQMRKSSDGESAGQRLTPQDVQHGFREHLGLFLRQIMPSILDNPVVKTVCKFRRMRAAVGHRNDAVRVAV